MAADWIKEPEALTVEQLSDWLGMCTCPPEAEIYIRLASGVVVPLMSVSVVATRTVDGLETDTVELR